MASFSAVLDRPASEVERPKPLPVGTYVCVVKGLPEFGESSKKKTPQVKFTLQPLQAYDDVDPDALTEMGGIAVRTISDTYYITEDALWRLKKFLTDCQIDEDGKTIRQMIDETPGRQVAVAIKHEASEDGSAVFARVASTSVVE